VGGVEDNEGWWLYQVEVKKPLLAYQYHHHHNELALAAATNTHTGLDTTVLS